MVAVVPLCCEHALVGLYAVKVPITSNPDKGDAQDSDRCHDTVSCIDGPAAFELSQLPFPVVSLCGLCAPRTVNRVATKASPPYPSAICGSENALESWPEMTLGKTAPL